MTLPTPGAIRTVLGDLSEVPAGMVYAHEHLILDSRLIATEFPQIHLPDVEAAVREVEMCRAAGAALLVDAMPVSAGRDVVRLAEISRRTGAALVAATGLHHDRYYGPGHWTNRVSVDDLTSLFVADLREGIDRYDYTGPIVERTESRAGVVKAATGGGHLSSRDRRVLEAVAAASVATGAPVLTHCEGGRGGAQQVAALVNLGVPAEAIILSHVDKADDIGYLRDLAATGAVLELDQGLRQAAAGPRSSTVRAIAALVADGFGDRLVVGTDGARRSLWTSLGGEPGLAWLASHLPPLLRQAGLDEAQLQAVLRENAVRALRWRAV